MGEIAADHVEAKLSGHRFRLRLDEPEARRGIDESADQPGRGDAVDLNSAARCPDASLPRRPSVFPRCVASLFQGREQGLRSLAAGGVEEIDRFDFGLLSLESGKARRHRRIRGVPGLHREGGVVHVPLIPEPADEFLGCDAVDEFGLGDVGRAAGRPGLLDDPPKDFEVFGIAGKHVDRILEGQCAGTRETMPDPGAQVDRLRRELMNEQVPPLAGHRALVSTVRSICQPLWKASRRCRRGRSLLGAPGGRCPN